MFWTLLRTVMVSVASSFTVAVASTLSNEPWPRRRNSRICSHSSGEHGAFWPRSLSIRSCRTVWVAKIKDDKFRVLFLFQDFLRS